MCYLCKESQAQHYLRADGRQTPVNRMEEAKMMIEEEDMPQMPQVDPDLLR